ncbi:MAG TPA: polysaccharide deacetylase family protein [Rubrobacter sp.]|jgi:peptidoglycan/xylan/chitin deacetylase (PgdA/CDA1 family)|nr:polysaccharide deacetylase family protein [Rubrobacter sp.]
MNVPINVLRIPSSSRVRSHGSSPLALLATVGLALVLGVMAVVLLQGGPAQAQQLGSTSQPAAGIVRLTFDDGPVRANTPRILNVLSNYRVKATFFVIGQRARRHPRLVKREYREGHSVQNHTYTHPDLTTLGPVETRRELRATNRAIRAAGVPRPYRFRPPYGHTNARVRSVGASLGLIQTLWSVDPHDWANPPASVICRRVASNVRPGSIVLLHDGTGTNTVQALPCIIKRLRAQGYGFGKL